MEQTTLYVLLRVPRHVALRENFATVCAPYGAIGIKLKVAPDGVTWTDYLVECEYAADPAVLKQQISAAFNLGEAGMLEAHVPAEMERADTALWKNMHEAYDVLKEEFTPELMQLTGLV